MEEIKGKFINYTINSSNIGILALGSSEEKAIILTSERMRELSKILTELKEKKLKGLIIISPRVDMFCAGADISAIKGIKTSKDGEKLAKEGQDVFNQIENIGFTTVAAISGPAIGGGCELALACNWRVITDNKKSLIGLPETKLGILPGFGGTQRLPRIIGLRSALDMILKGRVINAKKAKEIGLVHSVTSYEKLLSEATQIINNQRLKYNNSFGFLNHLFTNISFCRNIVLNKAKKIANSKKNSFYPAIRKSIDSIEYGLINGEQKGFKNEAKLLGELASSSESKSLVHLFNLTEKSKKLGKLGSKFDSINSLVIGAGTMGAGIAGLLAKFKNNVILRDRDLESVDRGLNSIAKTLSYSKSLNQTKQEAIVNSIKKSTNDSNEDLSNVDFVIEAVFEELSVKKQVFDSIIDKINPQSIICSNTSSIPISKIAKTIKNPERVIGMHFFNPVGRMPLVEIIVGKETSDKTIALVAGLATKLGKYPIIVKDVPGFLINRVLSPYMNEAQYLLKDGFKIEDIDKAALNFGLPMGPLRLLDEVGLDIINHVGQTMFNGYGDRMKTPNYPAKLVDLGRKGKKNKLGFYNFENNPKGIPDQSIYSLLEISKEQKPNLQLIQDRLIFSLINEAVLCLDQEVAGAPGIDAAEQIDLGSIMGTGFPAFRGGVIHYAESLGSKEVNKKLKELQKKYGNRFKPSEGITKRASKNKSFYKAI